ncbi:MAG: DUF885 domain-containing protein [Woeseiaceae bacterium]|nr:DUF885 domain-containing protein [Woeseiaceae bacterium]
MRPIFVASLAAVLFFTACSREQPPDAAPQAKASAAEQLDAVFDEYFERYLELHPLTATFVGDNRYNDRVANTLGPEHRAESLALEQEYLERLEAIDRSALDQQRQLSYDIFKLDREIEIEGDRFPGYLQPLNQFGSVMSYMVQLGSGASVHPFKTVEDYENWLSRVDDFAVLAEQLVDNMREGMQQGIVRPRILMEKALPQLESQFVENVEDSAFYGPIRNMPESFSDADRERLAAAFAIAIENKILPAFQSVYNFVGDDYMSAARETVGLSELPNGAEWYAFNVRVQTTTDMTPEEIHQVGLDEVTRIHDEMRGVMEEVGFEGDLHDFFDFMNSDDQFFYDEPEELIQGYRDMTENVTELARDLFEIFPETPFEVRRVEPYREQSAAGGSYQSGNPDGSRAGVFYANAYNMRARPKWAMESLFLHEAIPGHHFQIMIQRENEELPRFRRFGGFGAFIEGWGLYAETLGKELGVYTDPYSYFGALNAELWRAIRLVVDTGIHAKGWDKQQVLDYMYANSAVAEARAVAEAERFMAIPGQALSYKIGQLKMLEIRASAEERLGEKFDVKAFHTEVLRDGAMPLSMLEAKIDRWVDAQL